MRGQVKPSKGDMSGGTRWEESAERLEPPPHKIRVVDALGEFFRRLGIMTIRIAELRLAFETRSTELVVRAMGLLALEWSILIADLGILKLVTDGGEILTRPAMQLAREKSRSVFTQCMTYVAEHGNGDEALIVQLYRLAERLAVSEPIAYPVADTGGSARTAHRAAIYVVGPSRGRGCRACPVLRRRAVAQRVRGEATC